MKSIFNLARLSLIFLVSLLLYPLLRRHAIHLFLKTSGAAFIKLGQALSARPDIVGDKLSKTLSHFQDRLKPFSQKKIRKILKQEYGQEFEKIFADFNITPCASASIAQVHQATLKSGQKVAVKILRPNIAKIMARDIATLDLLTKITKFFGLSCTDILQDIAKVLKNAAKTELNLMQEASMAIKLKENLRDLEGFYVPKIYPELSSRQILVSEFLDGIPFTNKTAILDNSFDKKQTAKNLIIAYFTQVYRDGFFHADMHQGNLFLLKNGDIGVVDFGIMGEIDKKLRIAIAEILIGYLSKDYQKVAQIHIKAGLVPSDVNLFELSASCQKIGEKIVGNSVKDIPFIEILNQLVQMNKMYKMNTKPELLLLQKTIILVEGIGIMLDEDLNIWHIAQPWVQEWATKNLGFDAKIRDFVLDFIDLVKKYKS